MMNVIAPAIAAEARAATSRPQPLPAPDSAQRGIADARNGADSTQIDKKRQPFRIRRGRSRVEFARNRKILHDHGFGGLKPPCDGWSCCHDAVSDSGHCLLKRTSERCDRKSQTWCDPWLAEDLLW